MSLRPVDEVVDQLLGLVKPTGKSELRAIDDAVNCCAAKNIESPVKVSTWHRRQNIYRCGNSGRCRHRCDAGKHRTVWRRSEASVASRSVRECQVEGAGYRGGFFDHPQRGSVIGENIESGRLCGRRTG